MVCGSGLDGEGRAVSIRAARWAWFLAIFTLVPLPMLLLADASVPGARYLLLTGVTLLVAAREGASGPVPAIALLFGLHALAGLLLAAFGARLLVAAQAGLSPRARAGLFGAVLVAALGFALATEPYRTPFGRAPRANLLGALS